MAAIDGTVSGAGAGFAIGGPVGAVVGGVAGLIGGIFQDSAAQDSAEAQRRAGQINLQAGQINKGVYYDRAKTTRQNAEHADWQGRFTAYRLRAQNQINEQLSGLQYQEALRSADIIEQSAKRSRAFGDFQAAEFGAEAKDTLDTAATRGTRMFKEGQGVLGAGEVATAGSGFVQTGSELDRAVENLNRINLGIFDNAKQAQGEARRLNYAGKVAAYQGQVAEFEGMDQARTAKIGAEVGKFTDALDRWNTEQDAAIAVYEGAMNKRNLMSEATDLERQGDVALLYGMAGEQSANAGAAATSAAGTAGVFSSIASGINQYSQWSNRWNTGSMTSKSAAVTEAL